MLEQVGLLDPGFHMLLDHHLWLRIARIATIVYIPETLAAARYHAAAKNLANTPDFGREAFRVIDWMKSSPEFTSLFEQYKAKSLGGAHRLNAFYLLDGGQYRAALSAYKQAYQFYPPVVWKEWYRVLYAIFSLFGLSRLRVLYNRLRAIFRNRNSKTVG
jgi:hypothetical protein